SDRTRNLRLTTYSSTFFFSHILPPPISTLFPYTTLFRSGCCLLSHFSSLPSGKVFFFMKLCQKRQNRGLHGSCYARYFFVNVDRSEEHTSELQSLAYLVCRLLLEKKKVTIIIIFVLCLVY